MALSVQEILDLDIPSPSWSLRPSRAAPVRNDMDFLRIDDPASDDVGTSSYDRRKGKFFEVGTDQPRVKGKQDGLYVESGRETNWAEWSANPPNWDLSKVDKVNDPPELFEHSNAKSRGLVSADSESFRAAKTNAGSLSSNAEVIHFIVGYGNSDHCALSVRDNDSNGFAAYVIFDVNPSNSTHVVSQSSQFGTIHDINYDKIKGPDGRILYSVEIRYTPDNNGNPCNLWVQPSESGSNLYTDVYYAARYQKVRAPNPIVTASSAQTTGRDLVKIPIGNWYGRTGLTISMELKILARHQNNLIKPFKSENDSGHRIYLGNGSPPYNVVFYNGSTAIIRYNEVDTDNENLMHYNRYEKIIVSVSPDTLRMSLNGDTRQVSYSGDLLTDNGFIELGADNNGLLLYKNVDIYPTFMTKNQLTTLTSR